MKNKFGFFIQLNYSLESSETYAKRKSLKLEQKYFFAPILLNKKIGYVSDNSKKKNCIEKKIVKGALPPLPLLRLGQGRFWIESP